MAQYTKLLKSELQEIAGKFELDVIDYKSIEQGASNSSYLIHTHKGKCVLTVFEIEPIQVTYMSKVLLLLAQYDFPAPRLKTMSNGEVLAMYRQKAVLIKPYISGQVLENLAEEQVWQVGAALAKLHKIPAPNYLSRNHGYVEKTYPQVIAQDIDQDYRKWVERRHSEIAKNIPSNLPIGLVHGDLFCDNVLFEDEKFKAILDFEDISRTWKVFDLGMAVVGICIDDSKIVIRKVQALVNGYQAIRPLEQTEKHSLQDFVEWAALLTSTWRFSKYNIATPTREKSRHYMQMVTIAENVSLIPREEFNNAVFGKAQRL